MPIYDRLLAPLLKNLPLLLLSWSLVAVISVVAKDPSCKSLPMGGAEASVNLALGFVWKYVVLLLVIFYLAVAGFFAITGKNSRVEELQEKFFRPIAVPVLFQIAGLSGAILSTTATTYPDLLALGMAAAIVGLGLALHNTAYVFAFFRCEA